MHSEYVSASDGWIKLNANENPFPPSLQTLQAIQQASSLTQYYPDPYSPQLLDAIATHHQITKEQVVVGAGCSSLLHWIVQAFCTPQPNQGLIYYEPCYPLYRQLPIAHNIQHTPLTLNNNLQIDWPLYNNPQGSLCLLTNPHSPTGFAIPEHTIRSILNTFNGMVVIDEAYALFSLKDYTHLINEYPNLIIVRTFSKSHSLAGLRVAYTIGNPTHIQRISHLQGPYAVHSIGSVAALTALKDTAYTHKTTQKIIQLRNKMKLFFDELGWSMGGLECNFVFVRPRNLQGKESPQVAEFFYQQLKHNKILVRYFPEHPLTASWIRISVGTDSQLDVLFSTIKKIIQSS